MRTYLLNERLINEKEKINEFRYLDEDDDDGGGNYTILNVILAGRLSLVVLLLRLRGRRHPTHDND